LYGITFLIHILICYKSPISIRHFSINSPLDYGKSPEMIIQKEEKIYASHLKQIADEFVRHKHPKLYVVIVFIKITLISLYYLFPEDRTTFDYAKIEF